MGTGSFPKVATKDLVTNQHKKAILVGPAAMFDSFKDTLGKAAQSVADATNTPGNQVGAA